MNALDPVLLDDAVRRLVAAVQPEQIILFGSHAWGKPNADSDLDLCVIVSESIERPIRRMQRARRALMAVKIPKDVLVKTRKEIERYRDVFASLECQILTEGICLYDGRKVGESQSVAH